MWPTLPSLAAPAVVNTTTWSTASADKIVIINILWFQCRVDINHICIALFVKGQNDTQNRMGGHPHATAIENLVIISYGATKYHFAQLQY